MSALRVSVIVPLYNAARFVHDTLASVLTQTYPHWELIVVNDGSTDDSVEIARSFAGDQRVRIISQSNEGVASARNRGLNVAAGQLVAFLDADDIWLPTNLARKTQLLEHTSTVGLVQSAVQVVDAEGRPAGAVFEGGEGWVLDDLLQWRGDPIPLLPSNSVFPRRVLDEVGGFDPAFSTAADQDLKFRVAARYPVARVSGVEVLYRVHGANMHLDIMRMERDHLGVYGKAWRAGLFKSAAFRRRCYSNLYVILAGSHWHGGRKARALAWGLQAVITFPPSLRRLLLKSVQALGK